jgi:hypothetical protein
MALTNLKFPPAMVQLWRDDAALHVELSASDDFSGVRLTEIAVETHRAGGGKSRTLQSAAAPYPCYLPMP